MNIFSKVHHTIIALVVFSALLLLIGHFSRRTSSVQNQLERLLRGSESMQVIHTSSVVATPSPQIQLVFEDTKKVHWMPNVDPLTQTINEGVIVKTEGLLYDGQHQFQWTLLSNETPRILKITNLLTPEECSDILSYARDHVEQSRVVGVNSSDRVLTHTRSSTGMFLTGDKWDTLGNMALRRRIQILAGLNVDRWIEATQVLRYLEHQQYVPHPDFFSSGDTGNLKRGGQRIASVIAQLNDCPYGGGTVFPRARINGTHATSFTVKHRMGDGVLFYDTDVNFQEDYHAIHGGLPPENGSTKWAAVLWVHARPHY